MGECYNSHRESTGTAHPTPSRRGPFTRFAPHLSVGCDTPEPRRGPQLGCDMTLDLVCRSRSAALKTVKAIEDAVNRGTKRGWMSPADVGAIAVASEEASQVLLELHEEALATVPVLEEAIDADMPF